MNTNELESLIHILLSKNYRQRTVHKKLLRMLKKECICESSSNQVLGTIEKHLHDNQHLYNLLTDAQRQSIHKKLSGNIEKILQKQDNPNKSKRNEVFSIQRNRTEISLPAVAFPAIDCGEPSITLGPIRKRKLEKITIS